MEPMLVLAIVYAVALPITLPLAFRAAVRRRRDPLPWLLITMFAGPAGLLIHLYPARPPRPTPIPARTPISRVPRGEGSPSVFCPMCGERNAPGHQCHPARVEDRIHGRVVTRVGELPYLP